MKFVDLKKIITFIMLSISTNLVLADNLRLTDEELIKYSVEEFFNLICAGEGHVRIEDKVDGWIKKSDIEFLISVANKEVKCKAVSLTSSSYLDDGKSDAYNEASFLILGYKYNSYPPALNSVRHSLESNEMILEWARQIIRNQK